MDEQLQIVVDYNWDVVVACINELPYLETVEFNYIPATFHVLKCALCFSPPLTLSLTPTSPITIVQGDNAVITCSASEGIHLTSIQWSRESNVITAGVARTANSLSLTVSNVQLQDGGDYVCAAADSFGDMQTVTAILAIDGLCYKHSQTFCTRNFHVVISTFIHNMITVT